MKIGNTDIGLNHPPYIIAEIGVNHDGDVNRALELTDAAAQAGADAIKLQFFETDRLMSKAAKLAAYQKAAGETDPIEMLRRLELTIDEMALVVERAHSKGIHAIVTVFSTELVEIAETLPWDAYKTASPDIINYPLLEAMLNTGKPLIASTGAASFDEVRNAFFLLLDRNVPDIAMLHCVSSYPTPLEHAAIAGILALPQEIHYSQGAIGYSDHTRETITGALAVQIGASILEKHLTYDTNAVGPDHAASLKPNAFAEYVTLTKQQEQIAPEQYCQIMSTLCSLDTTPEQTQQIYNEILQHPAYGQITKQVLDCEQDVRQVARQSIVSTHDIPAGTTITRDMLTIKRPGTGIPPYQLNDLIGSKTSKPIEADTPIIEVDIN